MSVRRFISVAAVTVALSACGGAAATSGAAASALGGQPSAAGGGGATSAPGGVSAGSPAAGSGGPVTGHVGDKLTFANSGGDSVDATLVKVFDPARPNVASEASLPSGSHWVGIELTVDNHVDYHDESSTVDAVTSAGSPASNTAGGAVLGDGFAGCTQTTGSEQDSEIYTHCLAFVVPDGQTLAKVGIQVGLTGPSDEATWTVP